MEIFSPGDTESLLHLPKLEHSYVEELFGCANFSTLYHLKSINITVDKKKKVDKKVVMKGLYKMPVLEVLNIFPVIEEENLELVFEVIKMVISQKKNLNIELKVRFGEERFYQCIEVFRKHQSKKSVKTLEFRISSYSKLADKIIDFVKSFSEDYLSCMEEF